VVESTALEMRQTGDRIGFESLSLRHTGVFQYFAAIGPGTLLQLKR
jgi:hypothetical protein